MIRRNPTLIPLEDADVSDVKEFVARRKLAAAEQATRDGKKKEEKKGPFVAVEDAKRKREALTKEERVGMR
ncbi:hypothetical protein BU17DRAFT_46497 [Hysterangium stoloniferum]|nr:hypothetical protein BU17DRAFT_46497 [Hysterangium stoloniferum]